MKNTGNRSARRHMNIMTSCTENLIPYLSVTLYSLSDTQKNDDIDFYLLHSGISEKGIKTLRGFCAALGNITFHGITVNDNEVYEKIAEHGGNWVKETYYAICAHLYIPDADKVIYLDAGDILVIDDIYPYYTCKFRGKSLLVTGVTFKVAEDKRTRKKYMAPVEYNDFFSPDYHGKIVHGKIFNSGSYMLNLKKMREKNVCFDNYLSIIKVLDKTEKLADKNNSYYYFGDQALLAIAFVGDIEYQNIDKIMSDVTYQPYNFCVYSVFEYLKDAHRSTKLRYNPAVLHFVEAKPWDFEYASVIERLQNPSALRSLDELPKGADEYYRLWFKYASAADNMLKDIEPV